MHGTEKDELELFRTGCIGVEELCVEVSEVDENVEERFLLS